MRPKRRGRFGSGVGLVLNAVIKKIEVSGMRRKKTHLGRRRQEGFPEEEVTGPALQGKWQEDLPEG